VLVRRVRLDAAVALGAASGRLSNEKCLKELMAFTRWGQTVARVCLCVSQRQHVHWNSVEQ